MSRDSWGPLTWYFLHSFAHRIDEQTCTESIATIRSMYVDIISHLPCPTCTEHAVKYFTRERFSSIRDRDGLQAFIFRFHNDVNRRLDKPLFTPDETKQMYDRSSFPAIFNEFTRVYGNKIQNERLLMDAHQRRRILRELIQWVNANRLAFT